VLGIEPWPFSLRELVVMVEAKRVDDWNHTAALRQQIAATVAKRGRELRFSDFHPLMRQKPAGRKLNKQEGRRLLDAVFGIKPAPGRTQQPEKE
jgi:hypothetical protein